MKEILALAGTIELVVGAASLVAFIALVVLVGYRFKLSSEKDILVSKDADEKTKSKVLNKYDLTGIPKSDQAEVAMREMDYKFRTTRHLIYASVVIFLLAPIVYGVDAVIEYFTGGEDFTGIEDSSTCLSARSSASDAMRRREYSSAIQILKTNLSSCGKPAESYSALRELGRISAIQGTNFQANDYYQSALKEIRDQQNEFSSLQLGNAHHDVGISYEILGQLEEAEMSYRTSLQSYVPADTKVQAQASLARVLLESGEIGDANEAVRLILMLKESGGGGVSPIPDALLSCAYAITNDEAMFGESIENFSDLYFRPQTLDRLPNFLRYFQSPSFWPRRPTFPYPCLAMSDALEGYDGKDEFISRF